MLELYHAGLTACSKKSRLTLKEKGLDYVSHYVDLGRFEHHRPEYLALNPNGLVPTLVHDGTIVVESTVINEYIDEAFPDIPLRPSDPAGRAKMRLWGKMADEALGPNMVVAFSAKSGIGEGVRSLDPDELEEVLKRTPLIERRNAFRKLAEHGRFTDEDFAAAHEKAGFILEKAEAALADGPYLTGDMYTLADINMLPFMHRYRERVVPDLFTPERVPRLCDWLDRLLDRPAVKVTFAASDETRPTAA
jgi:glutathione S-transferase